MNIHLQEFATWSNNICTCFESSNTFQRSLLHATGSQTWRSILASIRGVKVLLKLQVLLPVLFLSLRTTSIIVVCRTSDRLVFVVTLFFLFILVEMLIESQVVDFLDDSKESFFNIWWVKGASFNETNSYVITKESVNVPLFSAYSRASS